MHLFVDAAGAISGKEYPEITVICIPGSRFTTHICHNARNDQVFCFKTPQHRFQVGVVESRITMLENDLFIG